MFASNGSGVATIGGLALDVNVDYLGQLIERLPSSQHVELPEFHRSGSKARGVAANALRVRQPRPAACRAWRQPTRKPLFRGRCRQVRGTARTRPQAEGSGEGCAELGHARARIGHHADRWRAALLSWRGRLELAGLRASRTSPRCSGNATGRRPSAPGLPPRLPSCGRSSALRGPACGRSALPLFAVASATRPPPSGRRRPGGRSKAAETWCGSWPPALLRTRPGTRPDHEQCARGMGPDAAGAELIRMALVLARTTSSMHSPSRAGAWPPPTRACGPS